MTEGEKEVATSSEYYDVEKNGALVLKLFTTYYQSNNHSGKIYDESPNFFLVKPQVLEGNVVPTRSSISCCLKTVFSVPRRAMVTSVCPSIAIRNWVITGWNCR